MIRKVEMERFTVISARPFDEVVAAIKTSIGNPNMAEFWKSMQEAKSAAELDAAIQLRTCRWSKFQSQTRPLQAKLLCAWSMRLLTTVTSFWRMECTF